MSKLKDFMLDIDAHAQTLVDEGYNFYEFMQAMTKKYGDMGGAYAEQLWNEHWQNQSSD